MRNALSENNKVTTVNIPIIPAVVAGTIEHRRSVGWDNAAIVGLWKAASSESAIRLVTFDTLLTALVVGYERELTEDERLAKDREEALDEIRRDYLRHMRGSGDGATLAGDLRYAQAIRKTLLACGVKLEGVTS